MVQCRQSGPALFTTNGWPRNRQPMDGSAAEIVSGEAGEKMSRG
ncbi:MAG: hypothetical protein AVDCRST_MAG51-379 [uncultured Ramlibacter sp.]|uniref:Uncharacterized protein n=1 Tax=uncultured Ramlibacter sp. TaxID=260755 RepID=A0A6J4NP58_9BURK|nr:MAG: hypothetical protein AVDCRST_MAG51-379 [uncultured Ramlibacter sp.]